jgi:hypothetical protein
MQLQPVLVVRVGDSLMSSKQYRRDTSSLSDGTGDSVVPVQEFGGGSYRSGQRSDGSFGQAIKVVS